MKQKQSNPQPQFLLKIALAFLVFFGFSTIPQTARASFLDDVLLLPGQLAEGAQIAATEVFPSFFNQASLASVFNDIQCFFGFNCAETANSQNPITDNQSQTSKSQKPLSGNQNPTTDNPESQQPESQTDIQPDQPKTPVQITQIINPTKEIQTIHTVTNNTNTVVVDNDTKNQVNHLLRQLNSDRPNYSTGQTVSLPTNLVSKTLNITSGDFNVDENGNVTANDITGNGNLTVQGNFTVSGSQTYSGAASFTATSTTPALLIEQTGSGNALQADNVTIKDSIIATNDGGALQFQTANNYLDANGNLVLSGDITAGKYNGLTINPTTKSLTVSNDATVSGTNTGDQTITLTGDITGSGTGSFATAIGNSKVTNVMLAGSIAASKLIGTDIAMVGTITTGTWNGTTISPVKGGTGIANGTNNTITFTGNYTLGLTLNANTSLVLPTSGTLATTSDKLNAFASTSSSELAGTISDETGSGSLVFATSPTFTTQLTTPKVVGDTTGLYLNEDGGAGIFVKDGGNVGIGNTNPSSKLEVTGDIRISSGSGGQIIFADGSTMASSGLGSAAALSNTTDAIMTGDSDANNTGAVILKTGSNDRLHILNNGNIGIGTASPNTKLDVRGGINAGTNGTEFTLSSSGAVVAITYNGLSLTSQATGYTISGGTASKTLTLDDNLTATTINSHLASTSNPHGVTQSQVGLGSVENTALSTWAGTGNITTVGTLANLNVTNPIFGSITGSAATLTTSRSIYGNNFNGSTDLSQIIASTYGGTGNGFTKFSGPNTSEKTFTLPNASATILTTNDLVTVPQGGTGTNTGSITGTGALTFTAGGSNQNVTLTPSGTGYTVLNGNVGVGTGVATVKLHIAGSTDTAQIVLQRNDSATPQGSISFQGISGSNATYGAAIEGYNGNLNFYSDSSPTDTANNLTSRLYIKSDGNVGIGTTAPLSKLNVYDSGDGAFLKLGTQTSASAGSSLNLRYNNTGGYGEIFSWDYTGAVARSTVFSSGNVGIGTTNPLVPLHVWGSGDAVESFRLGTAAADDYISMSNMGLTMNRHNGSAGNFAITTTNTGTYAATGGAIIFNPNNSEAMRILKSGNVGIGTTGPGVKLAINAGSDVDAIRINGANSGTYTLISNIYNSGTNSYARIGCWTGAAVCNTVIDFGNVGIGTTNPGKKLEIVDSASDTAQIRITRGTNSTDIGVDGNGFSRIVSVYGLGVLRGSTEIMRVGNNNNYVGIGTSTPAKELHVYGSRGGSDGDNGVAVFQNAGSSYSDVIKLYQSGEAGGTGSDFVEFYTNAGKIGDIDSNGSGTVNYNGFSGSHYGWADGSFEYGQIMRLTGDNKRMIDSGKGEPLYGFEVSTKENDPLILGSYFGKQDAFNGVTNAHSVAAVGNGDMWVADFGEDISQGDYLISSSEPGHARKDPGTFGVSHIIARAAENVQWDNVKIKTGSGKKHKMISVFYEFFSREKSFADFSNNDDGSTVVSGKLVDIWSATSTSEMEFGSSSNIIIQMVAHVLKSLGMMIKNGTASLKELAVDIFTAKQANIDQIQNNQIQTKQIQTEQMLGWQITAGEICVAGTDGETVCLDKNQFKDLIQKAGSSVTINQTYQAPVVPVDNGTTTEANE